MIASVIPRCRESAIFYASEKPLWRDGLLSVHPGPRQEYAITAGGYALDLKREVRSTLSTSLILSHSQPPARARGTAAMPIAMQWSG